MYRGRSFGSYSECSLAQGNSLENVNRYSVQVMTTIVILSES